MSRYYLLSKKQKVEFQIPETWSVLNNVSMEPYKKETSVYEMVKKALTEPIGGRALGELINPKDKIVIVVDDLTRPTPRAEIMSCLIDYLQNLGVGYNQIDILFGIGTHSPLSKTEMENAIGPDLFFKVRCTNHNCWSEDLVSVGKLEAGGDLKINPLFLSADFRIAVGSILPHFMAGFGGGPKLIMPGISNFDFIKQHHLSTFLPRSRLGEITNNPNYDSMCQAAKLAGLDFLINALYNSRHEVNGIVAGEFEKAHKAGVQMSLEEYAVRIEPAADLTIISAYPYDENNQVLKPLIPASMVTKRNGLVILFAPSLQSGRLAPPNEIWSQVHGNPAKIAADYISQGRLIVQNAPMDTNIAAYLNLFIASRIRVILVLPNTELAKRPEYGVRYTSKIEQAIEMAAIEVPEATVNILPSGGMIVPLVKDYLEFC
ncbi:MAG: nickel-dependent lactate racemase [Deltaproteobacteria bacterium]|nr:nickel-dependent lactate racemase [Deltaproteobacteria bacterium]